MLSVEHATLIGGDHILDVNERILTSVLLERFESLLNQLSKVERFSLAVVDLVSEVGVLCLHEVKNWKDLAIVGNHSFSDGIRAGNERL